MRFDGNTILKFWFHELSPGDWFKKSDRTDSLIKSRFGDVTEQAIKGAYDNHVKTLHDKLALIIVLDQFSRNIFRGTPKSFAGDARALSITKDILKADDYHSLSMDEKVFLYLPLEHSEHLEDQHLAVQLFTELGSDNYLNYAKMHLVIIEKFGRFPHRNEILSRQSSDAEIAFLKQPNSSF